MLISLKCRLNCNISFDTCRSLDLVNPHCAFKSALVYESVNKAEANEAYRTDKKTCVSFYVRKLDKRHESLHPYGLCFLLHGRFKVLHTGAEPTDCVGECREVLFASVAFG